MKMQKVIFSLLTALIILGFISCVIDKTPLEVKEEQCWNHQTTIRDFEFIKNRYFFVDTFYINYFEKGWSDDLSHWMYTESRLLRDLEVYISATYSNPDAIKGLAVLNPHEFIGLAPSAYDSILPIPGEIEKSDFIKLQENVDYKYDYARGFLRTNQQIADSRVLAISYKTDTDTMGTFSSEFTDTTKVPVFRLIKSRSLFHGHTELWPLMMKNVYSLGDSMINKECFNIRIEFNMHGEHEAIQQTDPRKTYMYLLGLDRNDENGYPIDGGNGTVDQNSLLVNRFEGILIFPGLHPFNPLPQSRFQIADTADLYNTTNPTNLQENHKYDIIITSKVDE